MTRSGMRRHVIATVLLLLAAVGVWGAVDLTIEHFRVLADPEHESWCTIEDTAFDCAKVSGSQWAEHQIFVFQIPMPTSIPPLGFFGGFALLVLLAWVRGGSSEYPAEQVRDDTLAFAWLLLLPAAVVDLLLIYVMKFQLQTWCIVCLCLDLATGTLLVLTPFSRPSGWKGLIRGGIAGALRHYNWLAFGAAFVLLVVCGQRAYTSAIAEAQQREFGRFVEWFETQEPSLTGLPQDTPRLGSEDAPFHVVEYADFQCPYCADCSADIHHLMEAYPDLIAFSFRHFPLGSECNPYNSNNMHPDACMAAYAAECAARHGKYWDMYNELFTLFQQAGHARKRPSVEQVRELAHGMGVPSSDFYYCLEEDAIRERIVEMVEEGKAYGVRGTPAVFVNGIAVGGGADGARRLELLLREHLRHQEADLGAPITFSEL